MKIYWFKAQAPRRVLALVKHLGLKAEFVELDLVGGELQSAQFKAINPNAKAPALVDGDYVLWEASAIMAHLCIKAGSDMWPANHPAEQVEVLRWLSWSDGQWNPAAGPFDLEHVVKPRFGFGAPDRESLKAKVATLVKYAKVLDDHLAGKDFVACGRLTIADFQAGSIAAAWKTAEMPFGDYRNIVRWLDGLMRIPAWADPWPANAIPRP